MRQEIFDPTHRLRRQPAEDVLHIGKRIVPVEFGGLNQAHCRRGTLTTAQRSGEQPVRPSQGDRADLILDMVVSSVLTSMSMITLPPVVISLPLKLMLFVIVDGWHLIIGSLVKTYTVT